MGTNYHDDSSEYGRIVLLDEQRSYGEALGVVLGLGNELTVVASEDRIEEGLRQIALLQPDVVVTSWRLGGERNGLDLAHCVRSQRGKNAPFADVPIVVLTSFPTPGLVRAAQMMSGVSVIAKNLPIDEIRDGIRVVMLGRRVFRGVSEDPYEFTEAELEVLERLAKGRNVTNIASELHLSVHAIRARIRGILVKTSSRSQLESVAKAMSVGIVAPPSTRMHS